MIQFDKITHYFLSRKLCGFSNDVWHGTGRCDSCVYTGYMRVAGDHDGRSSDQTVTTKASHYRLATCEKPFPRPLISTGGASVVAGRPLQTAENLWQEPLLKQTRVKKRETNAKHETKLFFTLVCVTPKQ